VVKYVSSRRVCLVAFTHANVAECFRETFDEVRICYGHELLQSLGLFNFKGRYADEISEPETSDISPFIKRHAISCMTINISIRGRD
jgi:hypothetical protein